MKNHILRAYDDYLSNTVLQAKLVQYFGNWYFKRMTQDELDQYYDGIIF